VTTRLFRPADTPPWFDPFSRSIDEKFAALGALASKNTVGAAEIDIDGPITVKEGFDSGDTDITGLVGGSAFGGLLEGQESGHLVIGIRGNDGGDSFSIVSGGGDYTSDDTYDKLIAKFQADGSVVFPGPLEVSGFLNLGSDDELTIASGAITATKSFHLVDTEADAATDNLDTINGGTIGNILVLQSANSARDVTLRDNVGNLRLAGNFTLATSAYSIVLIRRTTTWHELTRSAN